VRVPVLTLLFALLLFAGIAAPAGASETAHDAEHYVPPVWLVGFFVIMLLGIAILPNTKFRHQWERNRNRLLFSIVLAAFPVYHYLQHDPHAIAATMLHEYVPFIALLGSLFIISGGIRLTGDLRAIPSVNTTFIAVGTLLASFIGTTGASLLLIRPLLRTNRERRFKVHTVMFFIFLVSNIGGSLLPIGDPPLFLGYLQGVPFFWTLNLWPLWLPVSLTLLLVYYVVDHRYYAREEPAIKEWDRMAVEPLRIQGAINFLWLAGVVASVIFIHERSPIAFFRTPYLREATMALMVVFSRLTCPSEYWRKNNFTMGPILEVAALFLGIFLTMVPALSLLEARGSELGIDTPLEFFWATGILSSFLDNAPTYLVFFETAASAVNAGTMEAVDLVGQVGRQVPHVVLMAISAGAVFMGAMTYIGNGPNFMVRAIAEEAGIRMPSFFGYMRWSGLILVPLFIVLTAIYF
jgi:Na+/H+ antiporter NhaD/arsenite permease-like protein